MELQGLPTVRPEKERHTFARDEEPRMHAGKKIGTVLITGGRGNLGRKLTSHLLGGGLCERVVSLDHAGAVRGPADPRVVEVDIDLAHAESPMLAKAMDGVDAVVHFAASNPA